MTTDQQATDSRPSSPKTRKFTGPIRRHIFVIVLGIIPVLYLSTLAQSVVFGDPTEYTFVANILGIAHPPGYAFFTLMGKLFQTLNPFGDTPWRMHLLSAAAATMAAVFVYSTVLSIANRAWPRPDDGQTLYRAVALFTALIVALSTDFWQHAIHANPHIVTASFLAVNLFLLTRWWSGGGGEHWLLSFAFSAGLGITHHPLTVFSFPAYGLFILWVRPGVWRQGRLLFKMVAAGLLGLSVWLYLPIRSAMDPAFGPDTLYTLEGFLNHVLARGISEGLPFFGLADLPDRALVFWSLLRLQYSLPTIFLSVLGLLWLGFDRRSLPPNGSKPTAAAASRRQNHPLRPLALLYGLALLSNLLFVINLRQQDVMAYLLGVFLVVGLLSGVGLLGLLTLIARRVNIDNKVVALLLGAMFLLGPVLQVIQNLNRISLRDYDAAHAYVDTVFDWFEGQDEGAILLNDWEHMTPLWYARFVEQRWPDPADIEPVLVSTDRPWLENVFFYLPDHPVYLSGYRPDIAGAGFRLRPRDLFYQVVQPGDASIPPEVTAIEPAVAGELAIVGYKIPQRQVTAGDYVPLTLATSTPSGTEAYYTPVVRVGDMRFEFTTDSHLTTPQWQPGEVIIERFDFALPYDVAAGDYPVSVGVTNLSTMTDTGLVLNLGEIKVNEKDRAIQTGRLLANFRQRVGLVSAVARNGLLESRNAPWNDPIFARPGDTIHITLEWSSLAPAEESYTIFVHLIDLANRPLVTLDYTPLGGSTPTHLWVPKWLPGQRMKDPYRLTIPEDLPPGSYLVEVGLYEMTGGRRLHMADQEGNLVGDRYILGSIEVQP